MSFMAVQSALVGGGLRSIAPGGVRGGGVRCCCVVRIGAQLPDRGAAELRCSLSAEELLEQLLAIEKKMGRERVQPWGPRTLDLDILLFGNEIIDKPHLKVPHPLMQTRRFVMIPLSQIAPDVVHPLLGSTMRQIQCALEQP